MMLQPWELRVWTPLGTGPRIIPRDESCIPAIGLRMQLTPEGDCREAAFTARGNGLGVRTLDCVQIVYGGTPLFYGEVRDGGNVRDMDGHSYVLNSAALALKEVTLSPGFTTPQQPAHLTVRAILQDVINSGQLGRPAVIEFDPALCPDLGFDCRAVVDAHQQNAYALLERIAQDGAGYGVTVRFGVRPDRRFFCQSAQTTVRALNPAELISLKWREPVAEAPCTAVLWYVAKKADGTWLTHLSESPEAAIYRRRVKSVSLGSDQGMWEVMPATYHADVDSALSYFFADADATVLYDGKGATDRKADGSSYGGAQVERPTPTEAAPPKATDMVLTLKSVNGQLFDRVLFDGASGGRPITLNDKSLGVMWFGDVARQDVRAAVAEIRMSLAGDDFSTTPFLYTQEFRAERVRRDLLNRMAQYHYKTPAVEPADIELLTFIPPAELPKYITLTGHPSVTGTYQSIVDAWEYRLSAERGLLLGCLAGEAEDPAALAQADLIKARDGQAVITAITAGGTG